MKTQVARARVAAILDRLPARQRTLLALLLVERLTAAEAAGALGASTGEVESAYRHVLAALGRQIGRSARRTAPRVRLRRAA